jgi:hypothetical protein
MACSGISGAGREAVGLHRVFSIWSGPIRTSAGMLKLADSLITSDKIQIVLDPIGDLNGTRLFMKLHPSPTSEGLDIRLVLQKYLNTPFCETVFPDYV